MLLNFLRRNQHFFLPYVVVLIVVGLLQVFFTQEQLMRWVNVRNTPLADVFFTYATYMGDGAFFVIIGAILLLFNWRIGLVAFTSFALSSLTSLFLKQVVFSQRLRPLKFFEHSTYQYHIIKDLEIYSYNSFPSGHTISAFAVFSLLAFFDERKGRGGLFLGLAVLTAYSRVYLFQHFVEDTFAGSMIGTSASVITYLGLRRWAMTGNNESA